MLKTQLYIKYPRCAFLVDFLLRRLRININNSTCDTPLFMTNSFSMASHSFTVPVTFLQSFTNFWLQNITITTKQKNKQQNKTKIIDRKSVV